MDYNGLVKNFVLKEKTGYKETKFDKINKKKYNNYFLNYFDEVLDKKFTVLPYCGKFLKMLGVNKGNDMLGWWSYKPISLVFCRFLKRDIYLSKQKDFINSMMFVTNTKKLSSELATYPKSSVNSGDTNIRFGSRILSFKDFFVSGTVFYNLPVIGDRYYFNPLSQILFDKLTPNSRYNFNIYSKQNLNIFLTNSKGLIKIPIFKSLSKYIDASNLRHEYFWDPDSISGEGGVLFNDGGFQIVPRMFCHDQFYYNQFNDFPYIFLFFTFFNEFIWFY